MKTPIYNKGELLYNIVFKNIDYHPVNTVLDYDTMYKLISPFMLTKEVFDAGIKPYTQPNILYITKPEEILQPIINSDLQNRITISYDEKPDIQCPSSYIRPPLPPSQNQSIQPSRSIMLKEPVVKIPPPSHQNDPLFWNIYIAINGICEYECLNGKYINYIIDEKQKIVNHISSQVSLKTTIIKTFMKQNKITGISMKEMLSGILSNQSVSFKDVSIYCLFYKINITFVNHEKRMYFKVDGEPYTGNNIYIEFSVIPPRLTPNNKVPPIPQSTFVVKTYKYMVITNDNDIEAQIVRIKDYYKLESSLKPVGAISSYKVEDLKTIAEQLNISIDSDSKIKKNELYNIIDEKIKEVV